jgi:hypothetical protein
LKSSKDKASASYIEDSTLKIINIGAVIKFPEFVDSIEFSIKNEQKILIAQKKLLLSDASSSDTVWFQHVFTDPIKYTVTCIGYIQKGIIRSSEGFVQIYGLPPLNHKPLIAVTGHTTITSGETCNLAVTASDVDNNLTGAITMIKSPSGSLLNGALFTCKTSATYFGIDTVQFMVTDNGTPQLSDTATILISIRPATAGSENKLVVSNYSADTVFITWKASDKADQYYIYKTDKITGTLTLVDSVKTTSYKDTILQVLQRYVVNAIKDHKVIWISDTLKTSKALASDTTPPVFSFPSTITGTMTIRTPFFTTTFTCKDSSGIDTVMCTIGTQPILVTRLSDTSFSCSINNLESGKTYAILFTARDKSFKALSRDTIVHVTPAYTSIDTIRPTIERIQPLVDSSVTEQSNITCQFKCKDSSGISSVICTLGVRTITATKTSDTVYTATISGLTVGNNTIRATAFDSSGNAAALVFSVIYDLSIGDKKPPQIKCTSLPGGSGSVAKDTALLEIFSKDSSGVKSVTGYLGSTPFVFTKSTTNDSIYRAYISGLAAGVINTIKIISIDNSTNANKDSITVSLKYDTDSKKPALIRKIPVSDSSSIKTSTVTVRVKAYDESGVASVVFVLNDAATSLVKGTLVPADSTWTAVINNLVVNQFNKITIIATDSSLAANKDSLSFRIKYDPTMDDTTGPSIIQIGTPVSGSIVTKQVITIVDSIVDPSGISRATYAINGGVSKNMSAVAGKPGHYSFTDTLTKENANTVIVTAYDNATKKTSKTQTLTLNYVIPPKITTQPQSQSVCDTQAVFSLAATGTGPITYQWRKGTSTFIPITGAVNPVCTLKTLTSADNGTIISCVVSNSSDTVASALCTLTVNSISSKPIITATATSVCSGSPTTLAANGILGTGTWKWYTSKTGTPLTPTTANTLTVTPAKTTMYFARGEGKCGASDWDSILITVNTVSSKPTLTASATTICSGSPITLTATGTLETGGAWKWYTSKTDGVAATNPLTVSPTTTTTYFARGEGKCGVSDWESITITVNTVSSKPTLTATASTICAGSPTTLTATGALKNGDAWKWYTNKTGTPLTPTTENTLTVSPVETTTYFARSEGKCGSSDWESITITVKYKPVIETQPASIGGCLNGNAIFSVKVGTGSESATYQWLKGTEILTGKTNPSCTLITNTSTTGVYSCVVTNECGSTTSKTATLLLNTESVAPTSVYDSIVRNYDGTGKLINAIHYLKVFGGSLGSGASWQWYCTEFNQTSSGAIINVYMSDTSPYQMLHYTVRAVGSCNTTASVSINVYN